MKSKSSLYLKIWREVAREFNIAQVLAAIFPTVARQLPIEGLWIRQFNLQAMTIEPLAVSPDKDLSTPIKRHDVQPLIYWCRLGSLYTGEAASVERSLPGLVPPGILGEIVAAPLCDETPLGILIAETSQGVTFTPHQLEIFRNLQEACSVALNKHVHFQELVVLREVAEADNRSLRTRLDRQDISESVIGAESGLRSVVERLKLVSPSDAPVLILGETGSGKEVVARHLHTHSRRASGPFLRINCGAIPPELIDSQLFGHERGSFTGADTQHKGWFERADGGTLFLDEIGELPPAAQVRLLRILQDGTFERVGGQRQQRVDVRIVAATHRDLQAMVTRSRFREDLWYRIAVFPIVIPPLRDRKEDIPALAAHFALRAAKRIGVTSLAPTPEDTALLMAYQWPGNVRELAAVIERATILGNGLRLEVAKALGIGYTPSSNKPVPDIPLAPPNIATSHTSSLDEAMKQHIEAALKKTCGRVEGRYGAARLLAINPHTLRARMRKLGIDWTTYREDSLMH
jgi:transcriptional regulator with GAF, ATPase, and Fis domain